MSPRVNRLLVALLLLMTAITCGLALYLSMGFDTAITNILRGMGMGVGQAGITQDAWFLLVICVASAAGALGMTTRRVWGRIISLPVLGAYALWGFVTMLAPQSWRGDWFFIWMDWWAAAAVAAVLALVRFAWLSSRQARAEFQRPRTVS